MSPPPTETRSGQRRLPRRARNKATSNPPQKAASNFEPCPPRIEADIPLSEPPSITDIHPKGQHPASKSKTQGQNKSNVGSQPNRPTPYMQTMSQNRLSPDRKTTPSKQAYAGPTFHSSPAASSLPMPSFYSKSLPTLVASPASSATTQLDGEGSLDSDTDTVIPAQLEDSAMKPKEPSPLDFMFEAARKARGSSCVPSPDSRPACLSPFDDAHSSRSGLSRGASAESVFPFELDGNAGSPFSVGPAFATPYKERMQALRSPHDQPSTPPQTADEKERREKSEALKRLLSNASPLRSVSDLSPSNRYVPDQALQARFTNLNLQPQSPQNRGPPISHTNNQHYSVRRQHHQQVDGPNHESDHPAQRPSSSHLRREFQPDGFRSLAELGPDSRTPSLASVSPQLLRRPVSGQTNTRIGQKSFRPIGFPSQETGQPYGAQKVEDDLRRVLKLGSVSDHSPST